MGKRMYPKSSGFTLLELSIVIVIIGLIVAGISAGQSLVRQAGLRGLVSDIQQLKTSLNSFQLQYDDIPGDMTNAYDYWGVAASCTDADVNSVAGGCNGDGNGRVVSGTEGFRLWQHMNLAGVYDGSFTGVPSGGFMAMGVNAPETSLSGVAFMIRYDITVDGGDGPSFGFDAQSLDVGLENTAATVPNGSAFTPPEAKSIDLKMDDGMPGTGKIFANAGINAFGNSGCIVNSGGWDYAVANADIRCTFQIKIME